MLCEDDNEDHSKKEKLPKQLKLVKVCFAGITLNKSNTVIMKNLHNEELQIVMENLVAYKEQR
jgi:hypothetical protein